MKMLTEPKLPQARRSGVITSELDGEILIYDLARHRAHCLNASAAFVWRNCDGQRTEADLAVLWQEATGQPGGQEIVTLALRQLQRARLLEAMIETTGSRFSRQELLRKAGFVGAAAIVPTVLSIVAPPAAYAASCIHCGTSTPCTQGAVACCSPCTCTKYRGQYICK